MISDIFKFLYAFNAPSGSSFFNKFFSTAKSNDLPLPLFPTTALSPGEKLTTLFLPFMLKLTCFKIELVIFIFLSFVLIILDIGSSVAISKDSKAKSKLPNIKLFTSGSYGKALCQSENEKYAK